MFINSWNLIFCSASCAALPPTSGFVDFLPFLSFPLFSPLPSLLLFDFPASFFSRSFPGIAIALLVTTNGVWLGEGLLPMASISEISEAREEGEHFAAVAKQRAASKVVSLSSRRKWPSIRS
jgi:hypothetical protein